MSNNYDLVVVGSGFAGSMTTLKFLQTAQKLGKHARVLLVESGKDGERCGASRWTGAYLRLDEDLNFDMDWKKYVQKTNKGLADMSYVEKLEQIAGSTAKFVEDLGVELIRHEEKQIALEFDTNGYFVRPNGGGLAIVTKLIENIKKYSNCDIAWETTAEKLSTNDEGSVVGVTTRTKDGKRKHFPADHVMLACGGFEGNPEMLTQYIGNDAVDLPLIAPGLKYNKGAGIRMAMEVGAATSGAYDGIHAELVDTRSKKPDSVIWGNGYGILVDKSSKRFFDEGNAELFGSFELAAYYTWRDAQQKSWFIFDQKTYDHFFPGWVYQTTEVPPEKANTIEELAQKLGLQPSELKKTVVEFNQGCDGSKPHNYRKLDGKSTKGLDVNKSNWAVPIDTAPFYGFPTTANITFTYGGIKTNNDTQVLAENDSVIDGLYAAGEIHGFFYHEYPPATSVLRSLSFGGMAGELIANKLK